MHKYDFKRVGCVARGVFPGPAAVFQGRPRLLPHTPPRATKREPFARRAFGKHVGFGYVLEGLESLETSGRLVGTIPTYPGTSRMLC